MNQTTTTETIRIQAQKDPQQLEQEIAQQRSNIEDIVQALESKLSPGEMLDRVLNMGKGGGSEFAGNLTEAVKTNPLPALVAAAGLMWLYQSNKNAGTTTVHISETTTTEVEATKGSGIGDKLHSAKSVIGEKAHGAAGTIRSGASTAKASVSSGAQKAAQGYGAMLQENPLAAGAIAVAVGALLGALIPPTRKEDELLGEASDRAIDKVRSTAQQHREEIAQHAREMTQPRVPGIEDTQQGIGSSGGHGGEQGGGQAASPYGSQRAH